MGRVGNQFSRRTDEAGLRDITMVHPSGARRVGQEVGLRSDAHDPGHRMALPACRWTELGLPARSTGPLMDRIGARCWVRGVPMSLFGGRFRVHWVDDAPFPEPFARLEQTLSAILGGGVPGANALP